MNLEKAAKAEFALSASLFFLGAGTLLASLVLAPQLDDFTWPWLSVPIWGAIAVGLAFRVRRGNVGNLVYFLGVIWLTIAMCVGYWGMLTDA